MAQSLKPLSTIMIENPKADLAITSYLSKRCAALYSNIAAVTSDSNPSLSKKYEVAGADFLASSVGLGERAIKEKNPSYKSPPDEIPKAVQSVKEIASLYTPLMKSSYATTGSYLEDKTVRGDLDVCKSLHSSLVGK
jgi:hypothetical protein